MKLLELFEARSNPDLNQKGSTGHIAAREFLGRMDGDTRDLYGVSMTEIPKLGVNPRSSYNTPIGIYYYPAQYYLDRLTDYDKLDFQHDAPYIQIFEISGNILEISEMNHDLYNSNIRMLYRQVDNLAKLAGMPVKEVQDQIAEFMLRAPAEAKVDSYGGHFWYVLWAMSSYLTQGKETKNDNVSPVMWNKMFRLMNWDAVEDKGSGIIHQNEPYQGVVVNPAAIKHKKTFENKPEDKDRPKEIPPWKKMLKLSNGPIGYLVHQMTYHNNEYHNVLLDTLPENRKIADKIFAKVYAALQKDPSLFDKLYEIDIQFLMKLTDDIEAIRFMRSGQMISLWEKEYKKKFKMFVYLLNQYQSEGVLDTPLGRKQMVNTIGGDADRFYRIMRTLQHSTTLENPKAKEIYDAIHDAVVDYQEYASEVS